jgi:hypothetical protein
LDNRGDKKANHKWAIDNLARAFREHYSHLNWLRIFERLADIKESEHSELLDQEAFSTFL